MKIRWFLLVALVAVMISGTSYADTILANQINNYEFDGNPTAVVIESTVTDIGGSYLWSYLVTNNGYDPVPGTDPGDSNGFSGFELALPGGFPADLGNVTSPNANWESNCCSGLPMEWDIRNSEGLGILVGEQGTFSFTTLPRGIQTADDGWFHTWQDDVQTFIVEYGEANAPLAPDLLNPPKSVPEPASLTLLGIGLTGLLAVRRRVS